MLSGSCSDRLCCFFYRTEDEACHNIVSRHPHNVQRYTHMRHAGPCGLHLALVPGFQRFLWSWFDSTLGRSCQGWSESGGDQSRFSVVWSRCKTGAQLTLPLTAAVMRGHHNQKGRSFHINWLLLQSLNKLASRSVRKEMFAHAVPGIMCLNLSASQQVT